MVNEIANENNQDEVMNIQEAAAFMKCAVSTVYRDTAIGVIPCIRKGRRVLFLRSQLLDWLKNQSVSPTCFVVTK